MAKLRTKLTKMDEAYIKANLDKNSLELCEEMKVDQLVVAAFLKEARKDMAREPGRLKSDGKVIGATLTEAMSEHIPPKPNHDNLNAPYIFRRKNPQKE